jgi:hypothetical protein
MLKSAAMMPQRTERQKQMKLRDLIRKLAGYNPDYDVSIGIQKNLAPVEAGLYEIEVRLEEDGDCIVLLLSEE